MQVTLISFSIDSIEVTQHAAILNIPTLQRYDIVMEMFEEQASSQAFATWLRKGEVDAVLGSHASLFAPLPTGSHRTAGEPPGRVIRRTERGSRLRPIDGVAADDGPGRLRQPAQGKTGGVHRLLEDTRFKHARNLVVTRKWRVSNVPAELSAQRLSEALQLCNWAQILLGPPNPKGRSPTWSPLLGTQSSIPRATILAGNLAPAVAANQSQPPLATVSAQMQEGMKQTEILLAAQVKDMVDAKLSEVTKLQEQAVDDSITKLANHVEDRHRETQGELSKLGHALNAYACQTQKDLKAYDSSMDAKLEAMGDLLVAKLGAATRKRPAEEPEHKNQM
eukprot:3900465-Amphidinium_carterae.1